MSEVINLDNTTPAPENGYQDVLWQKASTSSGTDPSSGYPIFDVSGEVPNTGNVAVKTGDYTAAGADCGRTLVANSASAITFTLPASPPFAQWAIFIQNINTGVLTLSPNGLDLDGSASSITLAQGQGVYIATDGTNYFTERGLTDPNALIGVLGIVIDGGGSTPATGLKGFAQVPYGCSITGWSIIADQAGDASIDLWFMAGSAPPTAPSIPTSANKISASAPAAISSAQSAAGGNSAVSTWTTALSQWGTIAFNLSSVSTITRIILQIWVAKN